MSPKSHFGLGRSEEKKTGNSDKNETKAYQNERLRQKIKNKTKSEQNHETKR